MNLLTPLLRSVSTLLCVVVGQHQKVPHWHRRGKCIHVPRLTGQKIQSGLQPAQSLVKCSTVDSAVQHLGQKIWCIVCL